MVNKAFSSKKKQEKHPKKDSRLRKHVEEIKETSKIEED